jgi:hypothetical protein
MTLPAPSKRIRLLMSLRRWRVEQLETADLTATLKLSIIIGQLDRRIKKALKPKKKKPVFVQATLDFEAKKRHGIARAKAKRRKKMKRLKRKKNK